uniref:Uncharacterized protein n=1 Tax=viral metagenome TaxID=1070528 RepID=A0A6M3KLH6_9ZZZZ
MPYIRFQIDGAVEQSAYNALPAATKQAIRDKFLQLKTFCAKVNEGSDNEEDTVHFKWHLCYHDIGGPCEPEQDI